MQMVKKVFLTVLLVWIALIVMMPKQELYYKLEQELKNEGLVISGEVIDEGWFSLALEHPGIYYKGIKVATAEELSLFTLLVYSKASLSGLKIDSSLKRYAPEQIDEAVITHTVITPTEVGIQTSGIFGEASGMADLDERSLTLTFDEKKGLGMLSSKLKQGEEGWIYETSF